jgi:hypothetical protein
MSSINTIIERNFTYHSPKSEEDVKKYEKIREETRKYVREVINLLPDNRERGIAIERLEEVVLWANAAIARKNYVS